MNHGKVMNKNMNINAIINVKINVNINTNRKSSLTSDVVGSLNILRCKTNSTEFFIEIRVWFLGILAQLGDIVVEETVCRIEFKPRRTAVLDGRVDDLFALKT